MDEIEAGAGAGWRGVALRALRLAGRARNGIGGIDRIAALAPPAAEGSLGDQAMLDAAAAGLAAAGWSIATVNQNVGRDATALRTPATRHALGTGGPGGRASVRWGLARADALGVIGADALDGVYGARAALRRLDLMADARAAGTRPILFGSSFSATPDPAVVARLRAMPWLDLRARDAVSQARMEAAVGRPATLVADLAFLLAAEARAPAARDATAWVRARRGQGRPVAAINVSGHTLEVMGAGALERLAAVLRAWRDEPGGPALLLVPHDVRPAPIGDVAPAEALRAALGGDGDTVRLMAPPFDAWDAKAVAGETDVVATGRMHFAIAALGMGVPAVCVVYQGKFEGMLAHFGVEGLTIAPDQAAQAATMGPLLRATLARAPALSAQIAARLPAVEALSRRNFEPFGQISAGSR